MRMGAVAGEPDTLANGIRYAALPRPGAEVTTVSVWILAGSRHESRPGVAHLLEHVVMQSVPAGRSAPVIDDIEASGGDANAMTSRDHIVLHACVPTADAAAALSLLAAAVTTTEFDDDLVQSERRVVQEELRLAASDPTDIVHDVFFQAAYGDHPIGRPVGGTVTDVSRLQAADLAAWSRRHVRPATLGVVACGGLTADDVRACLSDSPLAELPGSDARPADSSPPVVAGRMDLALTSDTAAVVIGGQGFALSDPRLPAAEIVIELLTGSNASLLNEELRSRRGLSYDVSGAASGYREARLMADRRLHRPRAPRARGHADHRTADRGGAKRVDRRAGAAGQPPGCRDGAGRGGVFPGRNHAVRGSRLRG